MRCKIRKDIINNKRKEEKEKAKNSYSSILKQAPNMTANQNAYQPNITATIHATIVTSIVHAHFDNIGTPGTYEKLLNEMLTENQLPPVKAPANPPAKKILNAFYAIEMREQEMANTKK